jgi:uncharacterized membrane protein YccF (DUF307 family)
LGETNGIGVFLKKILEEFMASLGNVIWFVFGGAFLALFWLIIAGIFAITIIGLPIARACLEFAKLSAFPFGKEVIRETELKGTNNVSESAKTVYTVLNIVWLPIGLILTLVYFAYGILSFITIIGIPIGIVYVRMGQFLLFPVGARVVSKKQAYASAAANELEKRGLVGKGISASQQNAVVNPGQTPVEAISPEKQILKISQTNQVLTLAQIVSQTNLEIEEAEATIKKLMDKGLVKENVDQDGKTRFDFS